MKRPGWICPSCRRSHPYWAAFCPWCALPQAILRLKCWVCARPTLANLPHKHAS